MRNFILTILINILLLNMLAAQNGKFMLGAFLQKVDCELGNIHLDLKIKASVEGSEFYLADQNYRLSFNRAALRPGSVSIESELDISGVVETSEHFSVYSEHTTLGSGDTIISYNVELLYGSGYLVTADDWVSIGRIALDIVDINECFNIQFHTQDVFPPTYVSEVIDPITYVPVAGQYIDLEDCLYDYCDADIEDIVSSLEFVDYQNNIQIFPTAVHSELTVQYTLQGYTDMTGITIADMQGRILQQHQKQLTGEDTFRFDVSHLPPGIYLVNTLIEGRLIPKKFVKM